MSILRRIDDAVEASRDDDNLTVNENLGSLHISGSLSKEALVAWQAVFDEKPAWLTIDCIDEAQDTIEPKDGKAGEVHRLSIRFSSPADTPHILTLEGWRYFLFNDQALTSAEVVKLAFIDAGFTTRAVSIEPWEEGAPRSHQTHEKTPGNEASPRRHVRCQSPQLMAPSRIEPWVLVNAPSEDCQALAIWKDIASKMTVMSLPNELYEHDSVSKVCLSGQPPRKMILGNCTRDEVPFDALQEAVAWIYLEGEDIEVRHTFLSAELAREWTPDVSFCSGLNARLAGALESARLVYKAHLRSNSKDTLKALADLRKTLADEVQKLLQQSRDLSSIVWRDVAIAIGIIVLRVAMYKARTNEVTFGFAVVYCVIAIYIGFSYFMTVKTNERFLCLFEETRRSWRTKLYAFLDDEDYENLADRPVREAVKAYRNTQTLTTRVVMVVICVLIFSAIIEMQWIPQGINFLWESLVNGVYYVFELLQRGWAEGMSRLLSIAQACT